MQHTKQTTLDELLSNSAKNHTSIESLHKYIYELTQTMGSDTARRLLNKFKKTMFFVNNIESNPALFSHAKDKLSIPNKPPISDELLLIHSRMNRFLRSKKIICENTGSNSINKDYAPGTQFTWNIPDVFMPLFISYVLATAYHKNEPLEVKEFFDDIKKRLDESINVILESSKSISNDDIRNIYDNWMDDCLGRTYFCNAEALYQTYAQTEEQKKQLRYATSYLTHLVNLCPISQNCVIRYVNLLLADFENLLKQNIPDFNKRTLDLCLLYEHETPIHVQEENTLVEYFFRNFYDKLNEIYSFLLTFLAKHHKKASQYPLAVDDYDKFHTKLLNYRDSLVQDCNLLDSRIESAYHALKNSSNIEQALSLHLYIEKPEYKTLRISTLSSLFTTAYKKTLQKLKELSKIFALSNDSDPSHFDTKLKEYNAKEIRRLFWEPYESLCLDLEKKFKVLPDFLYLKCPGAVFEYQYSAIPDIDDTTLLRIIRILLKDTKALSSTDDKAILHILNTMGYQSPMDTNMVIDLLSNFSEIQKRLTEI